jgi:hypothetical protein
VCELALPLEFLPMSSVSFGLVLTLVVYDLTGIAHATLSGAFRKGTITEYIVVNGIAFVALLLLLG